MPLDQPVQVTERRDPNRSIQTGYLNSRAGHADGMLEFCLQALLPAAQNEGLVMRGPPLPSGQNSWVERDLGSGEIACLLKKGGVRRGETRGDPRPSRNNGQSRASLRISHDPSSL
jgi:hypothetical protein